MGAGWMPAKAREKRRFEAISRHLRQQFPPEAGGHGCHLEDGGHGERAPLGSRAVRLSRPGFVLISRFLDPDSGDSHSDLDRCSMIFNDFPWFSMIFNDFHASRLRCRLEDEFHVQNRSMAMASTWRNGPRRRTSMRRRSTEAWRWMKARPYLLHI